MSWTFIKWPVPGAEFGLTAENRNHVLGYKLSSRGQPLNKGAS